MPNIITHVLFADDVINRIDGSLAKSIETRKQLFEVGSNGPDFLFFHGMNPTSFLKKSQLRKIGNEAHHRYTNDFYISCLDSIKNETNKEIQTDMIVYVCGHLCHLALDSISHPYIFYRTGDCKAKSAWWHHRFESLIDAIMLKVKRDCTIHEFKAYTISKVSLEMARAMTRIYVPVVRNVFNQDIKPHQIYDSLQDWAFIQKMLYDPNATRFNTTIKLEKLFQKESMISGYFVPNEPQDPFDTMNLLHKEWKHPCDDTITSHASFFDLYDQAIDVALHWIDQFVKAINDDNKIHEFLNELNNVSYDTGLSYEHEMLYFDPVYEHEMY